MIYEEFVKTLEWFVTTQANNLTNHIHDKAIIVRAIRLSLSNPDFAQQYLDNLPKARMDVNNIPPGTVWYQGVFFFVKYRLNVLQHLGRL